MKNILSFVLLITFFGSASAQTTPYIIYNADGKKVSYKKMRKVLDKADVILFGELHNNPIAHWLQYEVTADLDQSRSLILGAEMMEADNQDELNAYLSGEYDYEMLDSTARLWPNFETDYQPLVDFARDNDLSFIATNIPRRYAQMVYKGGFEVLDSLTAEEQSWIAPLPIPFDPNLPTYVAILDMMGDHGTPELVKAQASKDATMAHFILENYEEGNLFIHYNGAYHSDEYEGILWYLQLQQPNLNYVTISTVSQENVHQLSAENKGKADFIICVDEDMTTTY